MSEAVIGILLLGHASAATLVVTKSTDAGAGSLRDTLAAAAEGDTITFAPDLASPITLTSGEIILSKQVIIKGPGARLLTISGNDASRIFEVTSSLTALSDISGLTLTHGNSVGTGSGGAIYNKGALVLTRCAVVQNAGGSGGGVANEGSLLVDECTFFFNTSTGNGGAVRNTGSLLLYNSTFTANLAPSSGAVASFTTSGPGAALTVTNCTIARNSATDPANAFGGGILNGSTSTAILYNTIVAGNFALTGRDLSGAFLTGGHNLIRIGAGSTGLVDEGPEGDRVGTTAFPYDPLLGGLENNGGPTDTLELMARSPAIGEGNDMNAPPRDQRGRLRNGTSDIGAYEFQGLLPVTLANISTRLSVQTGDNVLISGFIVTGDLPKPVVIRALGPSLPTDFSLADPRLEVYDGSGQLKAGNDNWRTEVSVLGETVFAPTNDLEAALLITLNPGAYTAIETGADGGTGIGLLEVYDFDRSIDSKLANISTRGLVQTGDDVLIGGFIVLGEDSQKVIVRALGPSLPVSGNLANPTLELFDENGVAMQFNDDWRTDQPTEITATGIPPTNDREAAIVTTLTEGPYTAIVRGAGDTTGIALIEVYAIE